MTDIIILELFEDPVLGLHLSATVSERFTAQILSSIEISSNYLSIYSNTFRCLKQFLLGTIDFFPISAVDMFQNNKNSQTCTSCTKQKIDET